MPTIEISLTESEIKDIISAYILTNYPGFAAKSVSFSVSAGCSDPRESYGPKLNSATVKLDRKPTTAFDEKYR